jgi:hypothetical protein
VSADQAWYVYCVVPAAYRAPLPDAILPATSIEALTFGPLTVLASLVSRSLFDQANAAHRTADPDWMAARVQAHHAVNVAATRAGPCLPLTFGALFSSLDLLRDWLAPRQGTLCDALAQAGELTEWTLALHEEPAAHAAWLDSHDPALCKLVDEAARAGEGTAFLLERRLDKARRMTRSQNLADLAAHVSSKLAEAGCTVLPEPPRQGLPHWTVLARDAGLPVLAASLDARLPPGCLSLRLTGPWPAYGFARAALSGEALHA